MEDVHFYDRNDEERRKEKNEHEHEAEDAGDETQKVRTVLTQADKDAITLWWNGGTPVGITGIVGGEGRARISVSKLSIQLNVDANVIRSFERS